MSDNIIKNIVDGELDEILKYQYNKRNYQCDKRKENAINPDANVDNVNHPSHYNSGGIECIDAMVSAFGVEEVKTFCKLNAFKYLWRAELKNGDEDIFKSKWYIDKYKELSE